MFVGLISDTHGVWDKEFQEFLEPCDQIWHAGDWGAGVDFTRKISGWKPVVGVYGNCDGQDIRGEYPAYQFFECGGMSVLMTHIGGYPGKYNPWLIPIFRKAVEHYDDPNQRIDLFVCGHSHILKVQYDSQFKFLTMNPGAAGKQGWQPCQTLLRFTIDGSKINDLEVIELERK